MTDDSPVSHNRPVVPLRPKTPRGERTRNRILQAAEREFGHKGFADASVSTITAEAGVAQGTFYIYFQSKEHALRELVLHMGRLVRHRLTRATAGARNRLEAERLGLRAFLTFVREHPELYRIVEESHFVDEAVYRRYYEDFASAYTAALEIAMARGEVGPGDAEIRAWALMGMTKMLGQRYAVWQPDRPLEEVVEEVMALVYDGLKPGRA